MLTNFFKKKAKRHTDDVLVTAVVTQTAALINNLHNQIDLRFNEISAQIKDLEHGLNQLETKLLTKDLKDKQAYGLLHYKLHETTSKKLSAEIEELEAALKNKDIKSNDH